VQQTGVQSGDLLFDQRPLLVAGTVAYDEGDVSLVISRIEPPGKQSVGRAANFAGYGALRYAAGMQRGKGGAAKIAAVNNA